MALLGSAVSVARLPGKYQHNLKKRMILSETHIQAIDMIIASVDLVISGRWSPTVIKMRMNRII